ncbi:MAG: hypothetical protein WC346_02855 [Methanogenium sp.]|jgi:hypothetical protein
MSDIEKLISQTFGKTLSEDAELLSALTDFIEDENQPVEDRARALVHSHTMPDSEPCSYEDALAELKSTDASIDVSNDEYCCNYMQCADDLQTLIICSDKYIAVITEYNAQVASRYCLARWGGSTRLIVDVVNCPYRLKKFLADDIARGYGYHNIDEVVSTMKCDLSIDRLKSMIYDGVA